jgi:hypothetical protein
MFSHDLAEKQTGRVEITDFSSAVIRTALRMMYTGLSNKHPPRDYEHLLEVTRFFDKYGMKHLLSACSEDLYLETNLLNVVDILVHVDSLNLGFTGLRENLITYVAM